VPAGLVAQDSVASAARVVKGVPDLVDLAVLVAMAETGRVFSELPARAALAVPVALALAALAAAAA
jgi:hypothetical protein